MISDTIIGVVGPCAAGKSTLISYLRARGYHVKHIAQEHSYVPTMWQRIAKPDLLIYLHASYPITIERRQLDWTEQEYQTQLDRLRHAREHADMNIDTDRLTPAQVLDSALDFLASSSVDPDRDNRL